jgi:lipopolysaccharide export system protein LptA
MNKFTWLLAGLFLSFQAWCLSTDKEQPIEIEADTAELDDRKGVTVYTGDVIVTQGSIRMTGDRMTVYYTDNKELDVVIMDGQPATYRQLPDDSEIYDEAEALQMEYYGKKNLIILTDKAVVKQEGLRFSGKRIEYDTELSKIKARGDTKTDQAGTVNGTGDGRVRITIQPKKQ